MKVRNAKHRLCFYAIPQFRIGKPGVRSGFVAVFPTWKVKPWSGYYWYGTTMVKRK